MHDSRTVRAARAAASMAVVLVATTSVMLGGSTVLSGLPDEPPAPQPSLALDLDDGPLFDMSGLMPGDVITRCIAVQAEFMPRDVAVRMYATEGPDVDRNLAPYLELEIDVGSGTPGRHDCADFVKEARLYRGTLAGLCADHGKWETGFDVGPTDGPLARIVRVQSSIADTNAAQAAAVEFDLVWEARET